MKLGGKGCGGDREGLGGREREVDLIKMHYMCE